MFNYLRSGVSTLLSSSSIISPVGSRSSILEPFTLILQQHRERKRSLKRPLTRQEKLERRLRREAREAARKQYTFMQRIQMQHMKKMLSISMQHPGRYVVEKEEHLPEKPTTNIYLKDGVRTQFYPIKNAVQLLRELYQPSVCNKPDGFLKLRMELNMETERATKPVKDSDDLIPIPHEFEHHEKRAIIAFAKDPTLQECAIECGAEIALGADMIKKIVKGEFRTEDYDFCVAHIDMAPHILPLRGILKSRFPTRLNGGLGEHLESIIKKFKSGVKVQIRTDTVYPKWGVAETVIGKLSMPDEDLEVNIEKIISATCKHRNPALGPFINRAVLMLADGNAYFPINIDAISPMPTAEQIEYIDKRRKKKKEKKAESSKTEAAAETAAQ